MTTMVFVNFPVTDIKKSTAFYEKIGFKKNPDFSKSSSSALISFTFANAQSVKDFGKLADENGGKSIHLDNGIPEEMMYGLEVQDPDGNCLEPVWMNPEMANN